MTNFRSSRQLAERVETEFHRRPNRFRRTTWWTGLILGSLPLVWLTFSAARGAQQIYQAGRLATPHRMFENDCAKCHTTWGPLTRLTTGNDYVHSVDNQKCLTCHAGSAHHKNQVPAHDDISCAACHREHHGDQDLTWVADRICATCHANLRTTEGESTAFARHIESFDAEGGHPEFALHRPLATSPADAEPLPNPLAAGDASQPRDPANLRFNHAKHLKAEYDAAGNLTLGLIGKDRQFVDLSRSCQTCHQLDAERRYMLPVNFERHCAECHPLFFDMQRFPGKTVPHESPDIVRGFLTDLYTLSALHATDNDRIQPHSPPRPIPGRSDRPLLDAEQADWLAQQVELAELTLRMHSHVLFGYEAHGGCRFCHALTESPDESSWQVVPTNIPARWMPHSRFRHDRHRMLGCTVCHSDVGSSERTSDVLMPSIQLCRTCHSSSPHQNSSQPLAGARATCVECHGYHDRSDENFDGPLNSDLQPQPSKAGQSPVSDRSK